MSDRRKVVGMDRRARLACGAAGIGLARFSCLSRLCGRFNGRIAMVGLRPHLRIGARGVGMLRLSGDGRNMSLLRRGLLLAGRTRRDSALATVVAHMILIGNV